MHIRQNSTLRKRPLPPIVKPYTLKVKGKKIAFDSLRAARAAAVINGRALGWENVTLTNKKGTVLSI